MLAQNAKVASIEALDAFRASLIIYVEKAGRILDEITEDVSRTRGWLQTDRMAYWKNRVRQRTKELAQADQEHLTARLSGMPEAIQNRRLLLNKAKDRLREAEAGLERVKHWLRKYETEAESRTKVVVQLRHTLSHDMTKAVAFLDAAAATLSAYAEIAPIGPSVPSDTPELKENKTQGDLP